MKVLLLQDVYKLGRAGDVKKVANGYGRNYLIPQGLAVLATPGALKHVEYITKKADEQRAILNNEMDAVARMIEGEVLTFGARASETGKLFGSVTTQMIADSLQEKLDVEVNRRQVDTQPLRNLGTHEVAIRLTIDLIPSIKVIVHREGEKPVLDVETEDEDEVLDEQSPDAEVETSVEVEEIIDEEAAVEN